MIKINIKNLVLLSAIVFAPAKSFANNLHEKTMRSIVSPYVDELAKSPKKRPSRAGLRLSLTENKDLPKKISYRIQGLDKTAPLIPADDTGLLPGLYEIILAEDGRESFRQRFIALPDLQSDLRLDYQQDKGFALKQTIDLPQVKFAKSKKAILKESRPILAYLAILLQDEKAIRTFVIQVHTDSGGQESSNTALTQARADEIKEFLAKKGIDSSRLQARGMGSSQALVPDTSKENRLKNRRVEFVLETTQEDHLLGKSH